MKLIDRKSSQLKKKINLITATNPNGIISEQYRKIRTNFLSCPNSINPQTVIITSPNQEEGKSTTAANFAVSLAQQGKNVLLIDANLRKSSLHSSFKVDNSIGLSNVLKGRNQLNDVIVQTEIKGLDLIPSGPPPLNPAELLGSNEMELLIDNVIKRYDMVLFDTPGVLEFADAKILANQCDSLILVIRWGKTKNEAAIEAKRLLEPDKAKLLGVILNDRV
nr:CpsD/CapB family tyrosine-protein kinase [Neobacillus sp. Marseille-Q6967]